MGAVGTIAGSGMRRQIPYDQIRTDDQRGVVRALANPAGEHLTQGEGGQCPAQESAPGIIGPRTESSTPISAVGIQVAS